MHFNGHKEVPRHRFQGHLILCWLQQKELFANIQYSVSSQISKCLKQTEHCHHPTYY